MIAQRSAETLIYTADERRRKFCKKRTAKFSQVDLSRNTFSFYHCEDVYSFSRRISPRRVPSYENSRFVKHNVDINPRIRSSHIKWGRAFSSMATLGSRSHGNFSVSCFWESCDVSTVSYKFIGLLEGATLNIWNVSG
jgi:hypothetical protein